VEEVLCGRCGDGGDEPHLMLCDGCDQGYHCFCVGLDSVPLEVWEASSYEAMKLFVLTLLHPTDLLAYFHQVVGRPVGRSFTTFTAECDVFVCVC
jgi:hypothetical protein